MLYFNLTCFYHVTLIVVLLSWLRFHAITVLCLCYANRNSILRRWSRLFLHAGTGVIHTKVQWWLIDFADKGSAVMVVTMTMSSMCYCYIVLYCSMAVIIIPCFLLSTACSFTNAFMRKFFYYLADPCEQSTEKLSDLANQWTVTLCHQGN